MSIRFADDAPDPTLGAHRARGRGGGVTFNDDVVENARESDSRKSWQQLKTAIKLKNVQLGADEEDRCSRSTYTRDSRRSSCRESFMQLVSELQQNKLPEGEALQKSDPRWRRGRTAAEAVLLRKLLDDINENAAWGRDEILAYVETLAAPRPSPMPLADGSDRYRTLPRASCPLQTIRSSDAEAEDSPTSPCTSSAVVLAL